MKKIDFYGDGFPKSYESPVLECLEVENEGPLCGSSSGAIGDIDYSGDGIKE